MSTNYFAHATAVIDAGAEIGHGSAIWHFSHLMPGCRVGNNCTIGQNVVIMSGVVLGNQVENGVTIGANATIVCGHTLGAFAFIGAGAVVTKDVPAYALIVGNPGRQSGWMSEFGHKLYFNENGIATCKESGQQYRLENKVVRRIV